MKSLKRLLVFCFLTIFIFCNITLQGSAALTAAHRINQDTDEDSTPETIPDIAQEEIPNISQPNMPTGVNGDSKIRIIGNPDYESDRFIIKHINDNALEKLVIMPEKFSVQVLSKDSISGKDSFVSRISLRDSEKIIDVVEMIRGLVNTSEIEYIQPDYEINLSSSDSYQEILNSPEKNMLSDNNIDSGSVNSLLDSLPPPFTRKLVESDPELQKYLSKISSNQLKQIISDNGEMLDSNLYLLKKLEHRLLASDTIISMSDQATYNCDIKTKEAWDISTGTDVIVGVIYTGIDINHEDLAGNIWTNSLEIDGNGIDDDANGYIDDINGWNFIDNSCVVFDNSIGENHGTHIAGLIAALKNNGIGIEGIAPSAKIMPLKVFGGGKAYTSDIISAIEYAERMNVRIINCSWGSSFENPALLETMKDSNILFVNDFIDEPENISPSINHASQNYEGEFNLLSNSLIEGQFIDISAGWSHSLGLENDGTVWAWGNNYYGQLGNGKMGIKKIAVQTIELDSVIEIFTGYAHSLALKNDGTVWAWGNNDYGQVGDNTNDLRVTALQVSGLSDIVNVSGGMDYSLAIKNDGTLWAWGDNYRGQLGDGTMVSKNTPVQVSGLNGVVDVSGGGYHAIALKNDGTVWAWGDNSRGQLGDGTVVSRNTPGQVTGLTNVIAISCGIAHNLALKNDGTVWAWGDNRFGQLGDGTTITRKSPVQVNGINGIVGISGGGGHSLALKNEGTVWAWGDNSEGQLGDNTMMSKSIPIQVIGQSGIIFISGGIYHSFALKNDGTAWAWGNNVSGQLGNGTTIAGTTAGQVSGINGAVSIAGMGYHVLALKNDGSIFAWGDNYFGQLGNGEKGFIETASWIMGTAVPDTITTEYNVYCEAGKPFDLLIKGHSITGFENRAMTVTYNVEDISAIDDLCAITYEKDTALGIIQEAGVTITQVSPGEIQFIINKLIAPDRVWSGVLNIIRFIPAVDDSIILTVTME